jgi:hypothetical protein
MPGIADSWVKKRNRTKPLYIFFIIMIIIIIIVSRSLSGPGKNFPKPLSTEN